MKRYGFLLPFGSFIDFTLRSYMKLFLTFYSLLGVSDELVSKEMAMELAELSTPFWEFLVCVLFKIFLSFSLKVFMKLIRTFVISSQNLALVF